MVGNFSALLAEFFYRNFIRSVGFVFLADIILAFANRTDKSDKISFSFFCHLSTPFSLT